MVKGTTIVKILSVVAIIVAFYFIVSAYCAFRNLFYCSILWRLSHETAWVVALVLFGFVALVQPSWKPDLVVGILMMIMVSASVGAWSVPVPTIEIPIPTARLPQGTGPIVPGQLLELVPSRANIPALTNVLVLGFLGTDGPVAVSEREQALSILVEVPIGNSGVLEAALADDRTTFVYKILLARSTATPTRTPATQSPTPTLTPTSTPAPHPKPSPASGTLHFVVPLDSVTNGVDTIKLNTDMRLVIVKEDSSSSINNSTVATTYGHYCVQPVAFVENEDTYWGWHNESADGLLLQAAPAEFPEIVARLTSAGAVWLVSDPTCI
jgi:hypothetical protein